MITEERLEKLERGLNRANRRNHWFLVGMGLCLLIVVVVCVFGLPAMTAQAAGAAPKEIRATNFILEDADGKTRAGLVMSEDGPVLRLNDEKGNMRAALYVHDKAGLSLFDENGKTRAFLGVVQNVPIMFLYDETGNARAQLFFSDKTGPGLFLFDEKHNRLPIK
jgi:hypothetical protein